MVVGGTSANAGHAQIPDVQNIMGGMESTAGVRLHNHRRKLRQRFDIIRKLGQGTYGKVQLGVNKETGQEVAIKTIKKAKIETEADLVRIRREIQIMSSVRHPNIIHIYEVFENREKMVLVMEYAAGGELYDYLSARKVLAEEEARRVFRQVASSVYYCHKHQICHRDLKLENILLDEKGNAKIADFGLSNVFDERRMLTTFCGSPLYASPEIVRGTPYIGPEVDCWSLGVLLYTLVYGAMPFDGSNFKRLVKQISQGDYYEPKKPSPASSLIRHMLTVDPKCRASAEDICTHWWVNEGYGESCLEIAEHLANQTPVRLDLLLSLIPPPPTPPSTATEPAAADETDSMNDYATAQSEPSKEEEEVGEGKSDSHEKKKKRKEKKEKDKDSKRKKEEEKEEAPPPAPIPPPLTEAPPPNEPTPLSSSQVFLDAIGPEPDTLPLPVPNSPEMEVDEGVSTSSSWTMAQDAPIPQDPPTEPEIPAEIVEFLPAMTSATESSVSEPKFEEVDDLPPASPVEFEIANSESVAAVQVLPLTPWQTHAEPPAEPSRDQSGLPESDSCVLRDSNTAKETNRTSIGSVFSDSSLRDLDKDSDKEMISPPSGRVSLRDRLETSGSTTPSTPSPTRLNDKRHSRVFRQAELFESQQQSQPASPPSRTMTLERPKKVTLYGLKVSDTRRMYEDKLANEKKPAVVVPSLKVSDAKRAFEISAATLKTRSASSSNNFSRSSTAFPRRTVILTPDSAPIQKPQPVTRPKSESSIKHSATSPLRVDSPPSAIESGSQPSKGKKDAASRKEEEEDREAVVVGGLGVRIGAVGKVTGIAMETKAVPSKPTTPTPVPVQVAAAPVPVPVNAPAGDVTQEKAARRAVKVSVKALELAPVVKRVASPEPAQHQVPVVVDTGVGPAHTVSMLVAGSTALNHTTSPPDTPRERFVASPPPDFPKRVASPPCKPPLSGRVTSPTRVMVVQSPPVERMTSPLPWTKAMPPAPARVKSPPPVPANTQSLTNLADNKSQILYPIQVTASTTGKKERIIPIQVEGRNRTAQATLPTPPPPTHPAGPTPAPPAQQTAPTPPPAVVTPPAEVVTRRQESVLSEAESDSSRLSGWREPIRKSPREVIIPIAMEGGGFVTPKVQTPSANTAEIKKPLRFDRSKRFGSLLSEEDDFGSGAMGLQRLSSFGKRHETPREEGWGRTSRRLERSDSVSSGDDDDDDTFQLLTAESLFSNLLSRVRHLTRRANRDEPILIRTRYTSPAPSNASEPRYSTTIHCTRESSDNGDGSRSTSRSENSRGRGDGGSEAGSANRWSRASPSSESGSSRTENMRRFPSRDESSSTWRRSSVPRETSLPPQESSSVTDTSAAYATSTLPRVRPASRVTLSVHVPAHPTSVSLVPAPSRITSSSALTLVQSPNPPSPWPLPQEREREAFNPGRHSWRSSVSFSVSSASSSPPSSIKSGDMDRYPLTAMLTRQALQSHLRQTGSDLIHPPQPNAREDSDNFSDASSSSSYRNNNLAWALARLNTVLKDTSAPREYTRTLSNRELGENGAPSTNNSNVQPKDGRRYQRYGRSATAGEWTDTNPSSKSDGSGLSDEETRLSYRTYTRTSSREYLSPDKDYGSLSNHSSRPTSPVSTNSLPRPVHHNPPPLQPVQEANEDSKAPTPQLERKCPPPAPVVIPVIPNALITPKPQPKGGSTSKIPVKPVKAPEPVPEPVPVVVLRSTPHRGARPYTAFYVPEMTNATPGPQATPIPVDQTNNGGICNGNVRWPTDTDEERKSAGGKRVSRFLRPDFFDTPREESAYVKKAPPIDLDAAEKAKAKFLKSVEKRWEKYRWDDAKNPVTAAATVNPPTVATITVKPPTLVDSSTQTSNTVTSPASSPPKPVISECVTPKSIMNQESHNCKESPPSQGQPVVSVKAKEPLEIVEVKKEEKGSKKSTEGKSSPKLKVRRQFEHLLNLAAAQFQRSGSPSKAKLAGKTESKEKEKEKESNGEVLEPNLIKPSAVLKIQRGERGGIPSVQTVQAQEDAEQGKFLEEVKKQSRPAVPVKPEHLKPQINGTRSTPASHGLSEDESYNELGSWGEEVVRTANLKMQENGKRNAKSPPVTRLPTECANPADLGSLGEDIVRAARQKRLDDTPTDVTEYSEEIPGTPTEYSWDSASVCSDLTRDREEDESVSDRIFRKSFYSRFNDAVNSTQPPRHHKSAKNRRSTTQEILDTPISHIHRENTEESISLPPRNPNLKYARQTSNIRSEESDAVFVRKFLSRSSSRHLENFDSNPAEGNHRSSVVSSVEDVTESDRYGLRLINSRESSVSRHSSLRDASMERSLPSSSSAKLRTSAATRDHSLSRFGDEKRSGTTSNSSVVTTLDMARNRSQTPAKSSYRTAESITSPATSSGNSEGREYRTYGASRTATSRFLGVDSERSLTDSSSDSRSLNRRSMAPPVADYSTSSLPRRLNRFSLHESQPAIRSLTRPSQETSASRYSSLLEDQSPWSPTSLRRPGLSSDLSSTSSSSSSAYPRREATSTSILTRDRDSSLSRRDPTSSMFFRGASTGLATDSYATLRNSAYLRPRR